MWGFSTLEIEQILIPDNRLIRESYTGKSFSEALTFALTNQQYDDRLFIELPVKYMKMSSSKHVVYKNCSECQNKNKKQFVDTACSELGIFMDSTDNSMNNCLWVS